MNIKREKNTMQFLIEQISRHVEEAFVSAGYDAAYGKVTLSNRPDLCEFQCNGALAAAKLYRCAPMNIATAAAAALDNSPVFSSVAAVMPGYLNFTLKEDFLAQYLTGMAQNEQFGLPQEENPRTIVVDYGGPNVAKPLHIGHLRSAIIGEALKRLYKFFGYNTIGDEVGS